MAKAKLTAVMTADSSGFQAGIAKANKSLGNLEKTSASMAKQAKLLGAAVLAAVGVIAIKAAKAVIKFGKELVILGQKSLSLKQSFKALAEAAGASSKKLLADMKKATKGTIAEIDLLSAANRMMLLGLDTSMFDEVMEIARRTAKATGQDINYMVDSLAMGLGRQSKMILDNLGIVFDVASAYEWYAETIGKSSAQLTESEKKLAFQTYAMKIASDNVNKLGEDTLTLIEIGDIFSATWSDLKALIGEKIVGALNDAAEAFGGWENILSNFKDWVENFLIKKIISAFDWVTKFIKTLKDEDWSEIRIAIETLAAAFVAVDVGAFGAEESATSFAENLKSSISGAVTLIITLKLLFLEFVLWLERSWFGKLVRWVASWQAFIEPTEANKKAFKELTDSMDKGIKETQTEIERTKKLLEGMGEAIETLPSEKEVKIEDNFDVAIGKHYQVEKFMETPIAPQYLEMNHNFGQVEDDLVEVTKKIQKEISMEELKMKHNFRQVEDNYAALKIVLKPIERTVTYTLRTVGEKPTAGLRAYQFGGIVPKTQNILAHGGEAVLTTEMQKNLISLLRKPQSVINYNYAMGDVNMASQLMRDEGFITKLARQISMRQGKEVM